MSTEIRSCNCENVFAFQAGSGIRTTRPLVEIPFFARDRGAKFQDDRYGKGMRVHNVGKKIARCTVCGKEKGL